ncbi:MAG: ferrous iron transport protein B [Bacteroidetes bacterium]|nr:ferrous iron transport protein B [Bacteroidota bacterium]
MTLSDLHTGDSAIITRIRGRGAFRKRITEMGFIRGKQVTVLKSAPLRDPVEYRIMDSNVTLRRSEAGLIEVVSGEVEFTGPLTSSLSRISDTVQKGPGEPRPGRTIDVALVGNPNSGKTTLFNRVSRSREHTGNYAGVTVDSKVATFNHRGYTFRITDLPGTYSLSDYTSEERYVREHILKEKPDVVVNVVDANNLERNLYLTSQLIDMDVTVVVALNMYDDLLERKDKLDVDLLSKLLGIRVVPTISHRGKGVFRLFNHVIRVVEEEDPAIRHIHINYGEEIEASVLKLQHMVRENPSITDHYSSRFISLKMIERDNNCAHLLSETKNFHEIRERSEKEIQKLESLFKADSETLVTNARYGFVAGAMKETMTRSGTDPGFSRSKQIDRILTSKYLGLPIFLGFLWIMFQATFTLGNYPMEWIASGVDLLSEFLRMHMHEGVLRDLLVDGIVGGVGGVIVFLPNILILFFFISLMEDTGYMARTAFIMDKVMHLFGLHGKSFIPLIMGFGCNVPAIIATRTLENRNDRLLTMLIIPFMSCSARLPVYVLIAGAVFPDNAGHVIFLLYMIGIFFSMIMSILFKKILFRNKEAPFVMELPVYRNPGIRVILRHMWGKGSHYLKKMGGVILVASVIIWALGYFPRDVDYSKDYSAMMAGEQDREKIDMLSMEQEAERQEHSFIGRFGIAIEPVIRPLGFDWKMGIALVTGFAGKEIVVSTMGVLYQANENAPSGESTSLESRIREQKYTTGKRAGEQVFTSLSGFSFLIFVLFYLPCVAVIAAVGRESGSWKWAAFVLFYTTAIAWLASFAVYQVGSLLYM